jgi:hypothetical protein
VVDDEVPALDEAELAEPLVEGDAGRLARSALASSTPIG